MKDIPITETVNQNSIAIDEMKPIEIVTLMLEEDQAIYQGVKPCLTHVASAVDLIVTQWKKGGRVFVVGAGTSGRIGVLDAVELGPTFSVPVDRWIGIVAGGQEAMWQPLEQHEDDETKVVDELRKYELNECDVVIGMTASGSTAFALAAIQYANDMNAATIGISCNYNTRISDVSDCAIEAVVGSEIIRGSTRLKAGTAQKMIINMLSTATMIRLGKVYQNQMIEVQLINDKLRKRAEQSLMDIAEVSEFEAQALMQETKYDLKKAIFISMTDTNIEVAERYLQQANGHLKKAIRNFL
ncbi:N-acetylmuramic acid 6-phosphate etherase 1 [Paraliobacillus quinghaiensis]|uniref:N-acetylmuramic acid 6-phosphate etherase n=1 Tax=Paraliobacillus quinghaiensis TaxID=470815 RepID=A0A917TQP8_9BACI|nr:N-acetylmuramic acid 6-phosphate etherase [Paraliobacillus quinghaiensis]GGM30515.1 N-acetylmuramic acid 6-phosphate etherase 1 [Paraliobacillus quinghaiensis]